MKSIPAFLAALAVLFLAWPRAAANEPDPWRSITWNQVVVPDGCVGDPVTPECAYATWEACRLFTVPRLCRLAGPSIVSTEDLSDVKLLHRYKIADVSPVDAQKTASRLKEVRPKMWAADDIAVRLWWQVCNPDGSCIPWWPKPKVYITRKTNGTWKIVSVHSPKILWRPDYLEVMRAAPEAPGPVRVISAEATTSECIGRPMTPLCAAETLEACFARHENALCAKVGFPSDEFAYARAYKQYFWEVHYSVVEKQVMAADDIPDWARRDHDLWYGPWREGDVALVIERQLCDEHVCGWPLGGRRETARETHIVRKTAKEWSIIEDRVNWR